MEAFRYHVFICDEQKPDGVPCCAARDSGRTIDALRREVATRGLLDEVQITVCGSLGLCERGPNLVVYPEGVWYSGVRPEDVPEIVRSHFEQGEVVERLANLDEPAMRAEIQANRARFLAAQRARESAGALPDELQQTARAFQDSRAILTAIELDLFSAVGQGATAEQAAQRANADARATAMLLNALVAMRLVEKRGGLYFNTELSSRFLAEGGRDDARAALLHTGHLWHTWSTLTQAVRRGTAISVVGPAARGEEWTRAFIAAMHRNATERAPLLVRAVGADGVRRMLDVGGGSGAYAIAFARASAELNADVVDLAPVLAIARGHIQAAGLESRVHTSEGDLRRDDLGSGYNLALVSAICHMLSPEENRDLLRRCREALAPGGRIVIQDFLLNPEKTGPKFAALFSLNMLVGTERGASYSEQEYAAWLEETGFTDVRRVELPAPTGLMIARRR
jgi:(2Fe-2S) ferredoxin/SAM-dependent methyltransferase